MCCHTENTGTKGPALSADFPSASYYSYNQDGMQQRGSFTSEIRSLGLPICAYDVGIAAHRRRNNGLSSCYRLVTDDAVDGHGPFLKSDLAIYWRSTRVGYKASQHTHQRYARRRSEGLVLQCLLTVRVCRERTVRRPTGEPAAGRFRTQAIG